MEMQHKYVVLNHNNFKNHKDWTWQFVVIHLVCSVLMILLQLLDIFPIRLSWPFFEILNLSVFLAFYNVYVFYQAFFEDFAMHLAVVQFFCVKGIVFICFCQVKYITPLMYKLS